jgi:hypothetical protein
MLNHYHTSGGSIQFLKKWKIYDFGQLLLVDKQKVPYFYKF